MLCGRSNHTEADAGGCSSTDINLWSPTMLAGESSAGEDVDVVAERKRVEGRLGKKDAVTMQKLWKVYPGNRLQPDRVAVKDLSLGVVAGECFGFL